MKTHVHPQILVIQKISSVLIHGRDVQTMLEKVLEIIDSEMGMHRGAFILRYGDTLRIETSHGLTDAAKKRGHTISAKELSATWRPPDAATAFPTSAKIPVS